MEYRRNKVSVAEVVFTGQCTKRSRYVNNNTVKWRLYRVPDLRINDTAVPSRHSWGQNMWTTSKYGEVSSEVHGRQKTHTFTFLDDLVVDAVCGLAVTGRNANPGAVVQGSGSSAEHGVGWHLQEAAGASRTLAAWLAAASTRVQTAPHLKSTTPHWPNLPHSLATRNLIFRQFQAVPLRTSQHDNEPQVYWLKTNPPSRFNPSKTSIIVVSLRIARFTTMKSTLRLYSVFYILCIIFTIRTVYLCNTHLLDVLMELQFSGSREVTLLNTE